MSAYASVETSPATTTVPVVTSVSTATRLLMSWVSRASRTASLTESASLSGCPSVTDSDVNRRLTGSPCRRHHGVPDAMRDDRLARLLADATGPVASMMVMALASEPNTAPPLTLLSTSRSHPLRASLARPSWRSSASSAAVSAAKPTMTWSRGRSWLSVASTSVVCLKATVSPPSPSFLILPSAGSTGVKSAGAAAMTRASASACSANIASARSAVDVTRTTSRPLGIGNATFAATRVTRAPRRAAARARAMPCRPEEALPRKRTGSRASWVPPALTTTCRPARSRARTASTVAGSSSSEAATAAMSKASGRRPGPVSVPVRRPEAGSMTRTPRSRSVATLACVAGCCHISVCMAGTIRTGQRAVSRTLVSRSSARPDAARASRSAVAGATTTRSAVWPMRTWGTSVTASKTPVWTGLPERAAHVVSPTKVRAFASGDHGDLVAGFAKAPEDFTRLVGGDSSGDSQDDAAHG